MENKHTLADLKQLQSMPLELKIRATKQRIAQWYDYWDGMVYVSFSGGKDSTVLKHIVDSMYDDVPAVFIDTGLEYPEIRRFAMSQPNVIVIKPKKRFDEVLSEYGYPIISKEIAKKTKDGKMAIQKGNENSYALAQFRGDYVSREGQPSIFNIEGWSYLLDSDFKISHQCCDVMKKQPAHRYGKETGRKPYIGTMADESMVRRQAWRRTGCNVFEGSAIKSQPMSFWTESDVLEYIDTYKIPYANDIYGEITHDDSGYHTTGASRTGCIFCGFGCHLEKEPNRFQRLKETHPKQWKYCIEGGCYAEDGNWKPTKEGLGMRRVLDYIGVKYE